MIYHYKTGKAGLYDPPFAYLKDAQAIIFGNERINTGIKSTFCDEYFASHSTEELRECLKQWEEELGIEHKEMELPWSS